MGRTHYPYAGNANKLRSITSGVHDDPELKAADQAKRAEPQEEQSFGVAPLPATTAPGNPISLAPGEKVPQSSDYTTNSVDSNVKLDRESYEKSDAYPTQTSSTQPSGNTFLSYGGGIFGLPPVTNSMIPESSLPIGGDAARAADSGYTMQSAAPESTTTALAGAVLKEPRGIPEMVVDSQRDAHVDAEASANPEAVMEKKEVEQELKQAVPKAPAYTTQFAARESTTAALAGAVPKEPRGVPEMVSESQRDAHVDPEASANSEAVKEKKEMEQELKQAIPEAPGMDDVNAPVAGVPGMVSESQHDAHVDPEASANPEAVMEKGEMEQELKRAVPEAAGMDDANAPVAGVPAMVTSSQQKAHQDPEAAAYPEAVKEKEALEDELTSKVKPTSEVADVPPTESAALSETAPSATTSNAGNFAGGAAVGGAALAGGAAAAGLASSSATGSKATAPSSTDIADEYIPSAIDPDTRANVASTGLNAPADAPAQSGLTEENQIAEQVPDSSDDDVSPMSKSPTMPNAPLATTGLTSGSAPTESKPAATTASKAAPSSSAPSTPSRPAPADKSKRRSQMFGKESSGTPDSGKSAASGDTGGKKKSLFARIKDKLKG